MSGNVFKRRVVPQDQVARAEAAAAHAPIVGDVRLTAAATPASAAAPPVYVVGQTYDVPLERVRSNPYNPRAIYTSDAVENMAQSLKANGQEVSATGFVEADSVVLIEGETRLRGARSAGLTSLRIEIKDKPASNKDLYRRARTANVDRRDQTPLDDAVKWKQLLADKVWENQKALAHDLQLPESTVSRTLSLAELPQQVMVRITEHAPLHSFQMLNAIREFCAGFGEEKTLEYIPEIVKNGWGYRKVAQDAAAAAKGPVKRPRGQTEPVLYGGAKGEIKTFSGGRLELSFKGLDDDKIADLVEKIKHLCSAA